MKSYKIGDKTYTQDELVLSQEEALAELVGPLMGSEATTAQMLVDRLLNQGGLRKALAVVLVPEGATVATRDLAATEAHLKDHITLSQQGEVIKDFFGINTPAANALKAFAAGEAAVKAMGAPKE